MHVCKDFHEVALDELWHTQLSLIPIILVLFRDAIQVKCVPRPAREEGVAETIRKAVPTRVLVGFWYIH